MSSSQRDDFELLDAEMAALVDLVRVVADIDDDFTPEEVDQISLIALEVGEDRFWAELRASQKKDVSPAHLADYAKAVERREAQQTIYSALEGLASSDGIDQDENTVLETLRHLWVLED